MEDKRLKQRFLNEKKQREDELVDFAVGDYVLRSRVDAKHRIKLQVANFVDPSDLVRTVARAGDRALSASPVGGDRGVEMMLSFGGYVVDSKIHQLDNHRSGAPGFLQHSRCVSSLKLKDTGWLKDS
ncbi:unnamed protein product [Phytophthora fragariaefolia]|uniref:Unnamed protein product n=1 Tax=Phytophthora fragariaefolia TaxID=1490495 RepID=A0A9W7DBD4_9STRA|nr:unnamed protein product [Phytophthora fragariaefolia]